MPGTKEAMQRVGKNLTMHGDHRTLAQDCELGGKQREGQQMCHEEVDPWPSTCTLSSGEASVRLSY